MQRRIQGREWTQSCGLSLHRKKEGIAFFATNSKCLISISDGVHRSYLKLSSFDLKEFIH